MPTAVAAFDWDGTLTVRDCVVPFLGRVAGNLGLGRRLLATPGALLAATARRDRDRLKALGVAAAFTGRPVAEVNEAGRRYAHYVASHWLRPDTLARLRWHQAMGHTVVVVSASLGPYLHPLGRELGVDGVVCSELAVRDERFTGELAGPNCRGHHKVERLRTWLATTGGGSRLAWAYGDSAGDEAMLACAEHPVRVGRRRLDAVPATGGPSS